MVMNKHYILSMMAAAVLLAGCSDIAEEQETRTPIRLITSIAPTRATTTQDVQIADGQNLYVWATAGASPYLTAWRLTADGAGGFSSQSSTPYYPNSPLAMTYIHGNIQPAIVDEKTELAATMSHTVKIDQRQAADYAISDLLYLNEASVSAQNTHAITLQHKLSKIAIVLTSSEYSNDLLAKADVRICGIKPQIAITTADGTLADATQGTQPATIRPYQSSASTPEFEAIIPCKQVKPDKLITISLNGQTAQLNPTAPADAAQFESGKKYTYTITISQTAITFANSTINNWTDYSGSTPISNVDSHNTIDIRRNPLWYVSKSNLNQDGTSFSTVASTSQGYLFTWASAMALGYTASTSSYDGYAMPTTPKSVTNDLDRGTWHMPTRMECKSIIPSDGNTDYIYTYIPAATVFTEPVCTFGYNDDTKFGEGNTSNPATPVGTAFKSYWSTYVADSYVRYAIRFLGTPYCSVWKYQGLDMASNSSTGRNIISSRLIDQINPDETARLEAMMTTITAADYDWTENENEGAVQRVFYNCGWNTAAQAAPGQSNGQWAFNWSTTEKSDKTTHSYCMRFSESLVYTPADYKTHGFSVRLFRDGTEITKNPLYYVAEYNMTNLPNAGTLTMASTDNAGYWYTWADAMSTFGASTSSYNSYKKGNKAISGYSGKTWHLPSRAEMLSIIPSPNDENIFAYISSVNTTALKEFPASEKPIWGYNSDTKNGIQEDAYFVYESSDAFYVIRFLGTPYCSIWKYAKSGGFTSSNYGILTITSKMLNDDITKDNVATLFGTATACAAEFDGLTFVNGNDVYKAAAKRVFYMRGTRVSAGSGSSANSNEGNNGTFVTSTQVNDTNFWDLHMGNGYINIYSNVTKTTGMSVRMFLDN